MRTGRGGPRFGAAALADHGERPAKRGDASIDDTALFAQVRAGEANAFAALFQRYYGVLCAFAARYTRSQTAAEDVVEDVFVHLWELRDQLVVRESLKSYLYIATRNRALNRMRDERTQLRGLERVPLDAPTPGMGQPSPALDEELDAADFARAVAEAIEGLPPRTKQVFVLHRQDGLTYAQIGAALAISPKTVENLLGRALKHLRAQLASFLTT